MSYMTRAYQAGYNPWWAADDESVFHAVATAIKAADDDPREQKRQNRYARYAEMYDNGRYHTADGHEVRFNVTQAVIDTAAAAIAGSRTLVMTLTKMGDDAMQKRAKKQNMFIEGMFDKTRQTDVAARAFVDACIFGTGVERLFARDATIHAMRVHPQDVLVPACEYASRHPGQLFEVEAMPAYKAIALWPEHEEMILSSQPVRDLDKNDSRNVVQCDQTSKTVYLHHAWKVPNFASDGGEDEVEDEDKGRYVCVLNNVTLESSEYDKGHLPHCFMNWVDDPYSFWGLGICSKVEPVQLELDALAWKIQETMRLCSTMVFFKKGGASDKQKFSNQIMAKYEYVTTPPIVQTTPPIDPAYFAERDKLYQRAFDLSGVSPMSAQGQLPAGLENGSGKAVRLIKDIASERLLLPSNAFDQLSVDAAYRMIDLARDIDAAGEGSYKIMAKSGNSLVDIKWSDVAMDADSFQLQRFPVSFLSSTPSSKMDDITELLASFPELKPFAMKHLDFPDLESFTSLASAPYDEVMYCLDSIVDEGVYRGPESETDLTIAGPLALAILRRARANGLDDERCNKLRDYILACQAQGKMRDQQMTPPGPPPGVPQGAPPPMPPQGAPQ